MYIVIFNPSSSDSEVLTDMKNFVEEFPDGDAAVTEATKWLDGSQYRDFKVYEEVES